MQVIGSVIGGVPEIFTMKDKICKHFDKDYTGKSCKYYVKTDKSKVGLCNLKLKCTFFCHFSEIYLGKYTGDSDVISADQLK